MKRLQPSAPAIALAAGLALAGATAGIAAAQAPQRPFRIDRFTIEHGLASNRVYGLVRDRAGFLWVSTRGGLHRFDGRVFVPYAQLDAAAPPELSGPISEIALDRAGRIWALASQSLLRIDPVTREVVRVATGPGLGGAVPDSSGTVWFVEGRTLKAAVEPGQPRPRGSGTSIATRSVLGFDPKIGQIATASDGALWLVQEDSVRAVVTRWDPRTGTRRSYPLGDLNQVLALREDARGRLWISTAHGLAKLEPATGSLHIVLPYPEAHTTTGFAPAPGGGLLLASEYWLLHIDTAGRVADRWSFPEVFGRGLLPTRLIVDREGAYWLGTTTGGIIRLSTAHGAFRHHSSRSVSPLPFASDFVMAVRERADGTIWVGTLRGGAYRISADWHRVDRFRHQPEVPGSLASDEVWDFEEDRSGHLWVLTNRGLCKLVTDRFQCLPNQWGSGDLARDSAGLFWIPVASKRAVVSFDPATGRFGDSVALPEMVSPVTVFADTDSGYLWIAGYGVARARVAAGRVLAPPTLVQSALADNNPPAVMHFHRDRRGVLWLASHDGLQRWDARAGRFHDVDVPGLSLGSVYSIAEDGRGRLWLGTENGLVQYSSVTGASRRFTEKDGFLSGESNRRAVVLRRSGELLFGGVNGLTQFDPESIATVRDSAPVILTQLRRFTSSGAIDEAIDAVTSRRLDPDDRAFTIEFTALDFASAPGRRFRYRLAGVSTDWIESTEPVATFQKPRPGRYEFHAQTAVGAEGAWSEPGAALQLVVIPPYWATTWFRALVLLAFTGVIWSVHRLRLRQALAAERLRLRISRDLHDDIGAGLSSIALISDTLGSERASEQERTQLRRIGEVARGLVADLRDIIWAIDPERDRLNDVVGRMQDVAAALLPGVKVTFVGPSAAELNARIGLGARRDLLLLYKEILHNVARHAAADAVRIEMLARGDAFILTVADNGRGFEAGSQNGQGTGLRSMRERAVRLGGAVDVSSRPGTGTTVRLTVKRT